MLETSLLYKLQWVLLDREEEFWTHAKRSFFSWVVLLRRSSDFFLKIQNKASAYEKKLLPVLKITEIFSLTEHLMNSSERATSSSRYHIKPEI